MYRVESKRWAQADRQHNYIVLNGLGSLYVCGTTLFEFVGTCEKGKLSPFSSTASERRQP